MLRELYGASPMEEVPFRANLKTGLSGHLAESGLRIPRQVVIQNVVIRPQAHESWNRDNRGTLWSEKVNCVPQGPDWVGEMLQDVQHQNQRIVFAGLKAKVEGANMDSVSMGTLIPHQFGAGFYPFHVAKFGQPIKEQAIATANVENLPSSPRYRKRTQGFNDEFCSSAPPPVLAVELAIDAAVSLVHKAFSAVKIVRGALDRKQFD